MEHVVDFTHLGHGFHLGDGELAVGGFLLGFDVGEDLVDLGLGFLLVALSPIFRLLLRDIM